MRKPLFTISGLPLWHQKSINKSCFSNPLSWTSFCFYLIFNVYQNCRFGDPLQNPMGAKIGPQIDNALQIVKKFHEIFRRWRVLFATSFSWNQSNSCAVWTYWFLKGYFSMQIGSFSLLSTFLCVMFHITFLLLSFIIPQ